jgi:plasmid segregation protein ParM
MRMMKTNKNEKIMVIGIDHGYGNMKTATRCWLRLQENWREKE